MVNLSPHAGTVYPLEKYRVNEPSSMGLILGGGNDSPGPSNAYDTVVQHDRAADFALRMVSAPSSGFNRCGVVSQNGSNVKPAIRGVERNHWPLFMRWFYTSEMR